MSLRTFLARRHRRALRDAARGPLRDFYAADPPDPTADWRAAEYLALDLETTGLERHDAIIAVGTVVVRDGLVRVGTARHRLVRSGRGVRRSATIHGLTDSAVAAGDALEGVLAEVLAALAGRVLLAHHAPFDVGFLDRACQALFGAKLEVPTVDTLALEARRYRRRGAVPEEGALRLGALRTQYGLPRYPAHGALTDALATAELFLAQAAHLDGDGALPLGHLLSG